MVIGVTTAMEPKPECYQNLFTYYYVASCHTAGDHMVRCNINVCCGTHMKSDRSLSAEVGETTPRNEFAMDRLFADIHTHAVRA